MTGNSATLAQALAMQQQGRLAEAAALCRQVLAREPRNSDALHLLGLAAATAGDVPQALALLAAAVQLQPGNAAMHANLGGALAQAGRHLEAVRLLRPRARSAAAAGRRTSRPWHRPHARRAAR